MWSDFLDTEIVDRLCVDYDIPDLIAMAQDTGQEKEIRIAATYILGLSEDDRVVQPLLALFTDANDARDQRITALDALLDMSVATYRDADDPERVPPPALRETIEGPLTRAATAILNDPNEKNEIRQNAVYALATMGSPEATRVLVGYLQQFIDGTKSIVDLIRGENVIVTAVANAMGRARERSAVMPLICLFSYIEQDVRKEVGWALGRIADPDAAEVFVELLERKDPTETDLRSTAV